MLSDVVFIVFGAITRVIAAVNAYIAARRASKSTLSG